MCPSNEKIANNENQFSMAHLTLLYREDPRTAICLQRHCSRRAAAAIPPDSDISPNIIGVNSKSNVIQNCYCAAATPAKSSPSNMSNARFCNLYKSRKTKSALFLIIFFCAIVLQKSSAVPVPVSGNSLILHTNQARQRYHQKILDQWSTPTLPHRHHHMQERAVENTTKKPNTTMNSGEICEAIKWQLRGVDIAYEDILQNFYNYIKIQYNTTSPAETPKQWLLHRLQLEHPLSEVLERNYTKMPNKELLFNHLLNEPRKIENETRYVHEALHTLNEAFRQIIEDRNNTTIRSTLLHDLNNNITDFTKITNIFVDVKGKLNSYLVELESTMKTFNITKQKYEPKVNHFHSDYKLRDMLLISEHLSVLQHLRALYMFLLDNCEHFFKSSSNKNIIENDNM